MAAAPADPPTGPAVTVRPAQPDELDRVGELTVRAYGAGGHLRADDPYVPVLRDAAARAAAGPVLVAEVGTRLVGTVTLCPPGTAFVELGGPGELELRFLAVDPRAWGRGVGPALVSAAAAEAGRLGLGRLVLFVLASNTAAHRMYRRLGFRRAPERDWWPDPAIALQAYDRAVGSSAATASGAAG